MGNPSISSRVAASIQTEFLTAAFLAGFFLECGAPARAQVLPDNFPDSLKTIPTPEPAMLNQYLRVDAKGAVTEGARAAAIALGKALFWDQAAGSDGQACASCHFSAGADSRTRNQLDPGLRAVPPQTRFDAAPPQDPNGVAPRFTADYQLRAGDFPLVKFRTPGVRASGIASDTQAVVSSQGVTNSIFANVDDSTFPQFAHGLPLNRRCPADVPELAQAPICDPRVLDPTGNGAIFSVDRRYAMNLVAADGTNRGIFGLASPQVRNVEPRNTPSVINAVFNYRNFWDARARNEFNGVNPIGDLDPFARVLINDNTGLHKVSLNGTLRLENASLASQAVGPALSDMEMSAQMRSFPDLGRKMLALPRALAGQLVAADDSVLGDNKLAGVRSAFPAPGLNVKYADLIKAAFQPRWWSAGQMAKVTRNADGAFQTDPDGTIQVIFLEPPTRGGPTSSGAWSAPSSATDSRFTQMEFNFSLFWGLAIQLYEATLRSDDSPMDQAFDYGSPFFFTSSQWGDAEKKGLDVFVSRAKCAGCHGGAELTSASVSNVTDEINELMTMADHESAFYDNGTYNIAARRCLAPNSGPVACDDIGLGGTIGPLDLPLSFTRFSQLQQAGDPRTAIVCQNQPQACARIMPVDPLDRVAVDGAFKTPGLRNIELTAPYFHNGGQLGLRDVVEFYDRGGDFPEYNIANLDLRIGDVQIDPDTGNLNFKGLGLTVDEKDALVAFLRALTDDRVRFQRAPFDHPQLFVPNLAGERDPITGRAIASLTELPAVGRNGSVTPLRTFDEKLSPAAPSPVRAVPAPAPIVPPATRFSAGASASSLR